MLALETTTEHPIAMLWLSPNTYIVERFPIQSADTSLLPVIEKILDEASLSWQQLTSLAVGIGPGSYTRVRMGIAIAHAWAVSTKRPLIPMCSLACLVSGSQHPRVAAVIDAKRNSYCWRLFDTSGNYPIALSDIHTSAEIVISQEWQQLGWQLIGEAPQEWKNISGCQIDQSPLNAQKISKMAQDTKAVTANQLRIVYAHSAQAWQQA